MNVWLNKTMDDFVWLLGSFVTTSDIVFDWYAMLRGVFIKFNDFSTKDGWVKFLFGGLVAVHQGGKHRGVLLLDRVFRC